MDEAFGAYTNLSISCAVSLFGLYWIYKDRPKNSAQFRYQAYLFWWLSWVAWVLAWVLLAWKPSPPENSDTLAKLLPKISVLVCDNFNTIFLVIVYFTLTRGSSYSRRRAWGDSLRIAGSLSFAYFSVYIAFGYMKEVPILAYEIHRAWSLCLGVFAPVLVGWAFHLRFKTRFLLIIGFAYGLSQPIVYATSLQTGSEEFEAILRELKPVVDMTLAFMKVIWAVLCTKVLSSGHSSDRSLAECDPYGSSQLLHKWRASVAIHAGWILAVYLALLSMLLFQYAKEKRFLTDFAVAMSIFSGFIAYLQLVWYFVDWLLRKRIV